MICGFLFLWIDTQNVTGFSQVLGAPQQLGTLRFSTLRPVRNLPRLLCAAGLSCLLTLGASAPGTADRGASDTSPASHVTEAVNERAADVRSIISTQTSDQNTADDVDPVWSEILNSHAEQLRQRVADYASSYQPPEQPEDPEDPEPSPDPEEEGTDDEVREETEDQPPSSDDHDTDDDAGTPDEHTPAPDDQGQAPDAQREDPIFTTNPSGPVNCAEVNCVALTFDDGPVPNTRAVLTALEAVNGRATFFMTGHMAAAHPLIASQVTAAGHEVANHGWSHTNFTELTPEQLADEITRTADAVESASGVRPRLVRPPYGATTEQINRQVGGPMIMWDVDSRDWATRNAAETHAQVIEQVQPGSIVLLHDLHASTAQAVPAIVADLLAEGYHLVTVSEIIGHGADGQVYRRGMSP